MINAFQFHLEVKNAKPFKKRAQRAFNASVQIALAIVLILSYLAPDAKASDAWKPFGDSDEQFQVKRSRNKQTKAQLPAAAPVNRKHTPYGSEPPEIFSDRQTHVNNSGQSGYLSTFTKHSPAIPAVERSDLAPIISSASGLPFGLWQGLDAAYAEQLVAPLQMPATSAALQKLWLRILTTSDKAEKAPQFSALRVEGLFRSGRLTEASQLLRKAVAAFPGEKALTVLQARTELALGNRDIGCKSAKTAAGSQSNLSQAMRGEAIILAGYCAVSAGNKAAARLTAELALAAGYSNRFTLTILEAITSGRKSRRPLPDVVNTTDYLLLKEVGFNQPKALIKHASPALLSILMTDAALPAAIRLHAAEAAAKRNVIDGDTLADAYRRLGGQIPAQAATEGPLQRAHLFRTAENFPSRLKRTRTIRQLIDEGQREGLSIPIMVAVQPIVAQLKPAPEIGWFALTAIEVMLAAADYNGIVPWLSLPPPQNQIVEQNLQHWHTLADMANATSRDRAINLQPLVPLTQGGRFHGIELRRLTTVLDALGYNVPIPVWNAAHQTQQPTSGNLPPTGILTQLLAASKAKQTAHTALLVLRTLNGSRASDTHLIALGDAIRGLKRAGLEDDARRLAFEAVFASWPRTGTY